MKYKGLKRRGEQPAVACDNDLKIGMTRWERKVRAALLNKNQISTQWEIAWY